MRTHLQWAGLCISMILISSSLLAQTGTIKGILEDDQTREPVIGGNVTLKGTSHGSVTDTDGNFVITNVPAGSQTLVFSYIGFSSKEVGINVPADGEVNVGVIKIASQAIGLGEISIIASVAIDRKTPVAVSTIKGSAIEAKAGNQEFPEMLRSTPSVYVTKQGGGFGDSRINVRGFDQRNIAVMINGIPVNDMENGWVYWSNWAGLSDVTSSIQVQRGLSASKLAISSVGGTINIVTNAAEMKKGGSASMSLGNDNYYKYGAVYSTGLSPKGWALSLQATHTRGDGYIEGTMFRAYSYFLSVAKEFNENHSLHFTALGAPQWHHQNGFANTILAYDQYEKKYNSNWGYLDDEEFSMTRNFYHKPKIFLNDYITLGDKTELATSAYASFGRGGGTGDLGRINGYTVYSLPKTSDGLIRFDDLIAWNSGSSVTGFGADNQTWNSGGGFDGQYVGVNANPGRGIIRRSSMNEHNWFGILANLTHYLSDDFTFIGGVDARKYKGLHYRRVENLMGLSAFYDDDDINQPDKYIADEGRAEGNQIDYNNDGIVNWLGLFGQLEYSRGKISAFLSGSLSNQGFKRIDYFLYDDADPMQESDWQNFLGGTIKTGLNFNISDVHNVYFNGGYFSQQPVFGNVFRNFTNEVNTTVENQDVVGLELGYGIRTSAFSGNFNLYNTEWRNRQITKSFNVDGVSGTANFVGVGQLHQGIELDFTASPSSKLTLNGMASLGNWRYSDDFGATVYDDNQNSLGERFLYVKDVKVGDAAQTTFSLGGEYEVVRNLTISASFYHAEDLYADFNIGRDGSILTPGNEAWRLPSYDLLDAGMGYKFKLGDVNVAWRLNVNNVLDEQYISESDTNILYNADIDTREIGNNGSPRNRVYYGFGMTWNTSVKIGF